MAVDRNNMTLLVIVGAARREPMRECRSDSAGFSGELGERCWNCSRPMLPAHRAMCQRSRIAVTL